MNTDASLSYDVVPVPLGLVEEAMDARPPDPGAKGVGPWPFLATTGIATSRAPSDATPPHAIPDASSVT